MCSGLGAPRAPKSWHGSPSVPHVKASYSSCIFSTTMSSEKENQEGRVQLAIKALNDGVVDTVRTAARHYEVPRETFHRRMRGSLPRADKTPNRQKLSVQEEEVLKEWILDLDLRGYAPRCEHVGKRAQILLAERFKSTLLTPGAIG